MTTHSDSPLIQIAFVCVQNAGRSQMAYAFAEQALETRDLDDGIEILMGGTQPADEIHPEVEQAMHAVGIDLSGRTPREVTFEEIQASDYVITMGCSADDVCPAGWAGENRDWDLDDPHGKPPSEVATIRDEIKQRVHDLLDELDQPT